MPLETASRIDQLVPSNPSGSESLSQSDDHIRVIKAAIQGTFPFLTGVVQATHTEINNACMGATVPVQSALSTKADKNGDTYTGIHNFGGATINVLTQGQTDNSTKAASTAFVQAAVLSAALGPSVPVFGGNAGTVLRVEANDTLTWAKNIRIPSTQTGNFNAVGGYNYILAGGSAQTITMPAAPAANDTIEVNVINGRSDNVINWNGRKHENISDATMTIDLTNPSMTLFYVNDSFGWKIIL
jgi:hypothetical protein